MAKLKADPDAGRQRHFHRGHVAIGIGLALVIASQALAPRPMHPAGLRLAAFLAVDLGGVVCLCIGTWYVYRIQRKAK